MMFPHEPTQVPFLTPSHALYFGDNRKVWDAENGFQICNFDRKASFVMLAIPTTTMKISMQAYTSSIISF